MTAFVVIDRRSRSAWREWPEVRPALEKLFPGMQAAESHAQGETARLVRAALKDGHLDIIAVGGDGTINEAVNGFFEQGVPLSPDAVLGFVSPGAESDFRRTFGIRPGPEAALARLRQARIHRLDVGHVSCLAPSGTPVSRFFVNAASFGLSGKLAARLGRARLARLFGDRFAFGFHAIMALAFWRPQRIRLIADGGYDEIAGITGVAVANGRWFGGGVRVAPEAEPGDGKFDIVVMGGAGRLAAFKALRGGGAPGARTVRASRLVAAPTLETGGAVAVETDGESAGLLPATFEILPGAINLRC